MGEVTEKVYCCDRGDNDNALAAAILAGNNRRDDWGPMAAMMGGGMNNWMNNPFAYLMFMALLRISERPSFLLTIQKDKLYVVIQRYKAELSCIHS